MYINICLFLMQKEVIKCFVSFAIFGIVVLLKKKILMIESSLINSIYHECIMKHEIGRNFIIVHTEIFLVFKFV